MASVCSNFMSNFFWNIVCDKLIVAAAKSGACKKVVRFLKLSELISWWIRSIIRHNWPQQKQGKSCDSVFKLAEYLDFNECIWAVSKVGGKHESESLPRSISLILSNRRFCSLCFNLCAAVRSLPDFGNDLVKTLRRVRDRFDGSTPVFSFSRYRQLRLLLH